MSVLVGKRCYLSGPIEYSDLSANWRIDVRRTLRDEFHIDLFDPFDDPKQQWVPILKEAQDKCDFDTMHEISKAFVHKDLAMVDRADFVIAYLPHKVPTTGTHHEIINSANAKKPTLLVCPQGKQFVPLWYYGFIPHEVMFSSWGDLYKYLREVNEGKHMKNKRWAFVYGLI
jgi:nucleoside 2-deoxyribosyltransferase